MLISRGKWSLVYFGYNPLPGRRARPRLNDILDRTGGISGRSADAVRPVFHHGSIPSETTPDALQKAYVTSFDASDPRPDRNPGAGRSGRPRAIGCITRSTRKAGGEYSMDHKLGHLCDGPGRPLSPPGFTHESTPEQNRRTTEEIV